MKSTPIPFFLFLVLFFWQCRVSTPTVHIVSKDGPGLLSIAATGYGERQVTAEHDARHLVLQRLIFDGIPNASVADARLPLVPAGTTLTDHQRKALDEVLAVPYSDRFFNNLSKDGAGRASNLKKSRDFVFQVNYDLLRKELESRSVVRKFGL